MQDDQQIEELVYFKDFNYPREYRVSIGWKIFLLFLATVSIAGSVYSLVYMFSIDPEFLSFISVGASIFFLLLGLYLFVDTIKSKIILYIDKIEIYGIKSMRSIYRDEIASVVDYEHELYLIPKDSLRKKIKMYVYNIKIDEALWCWISSLSNLDEEDAVKHFEETKKELFPDKDLEEVDKSLINGEKLAKAISIITIIIGGLAFFVDNHYLLISLAVIPLIVLIIAGKNKGLFNLSGNILDLRPKLSWPLFIPGLILSRYLFININIIDLQELFILATSSTLLMVIIAVRVDGQLLKDNKWGFVAVLLFLAIYNIGAVGTLNSLLDTKKPQQVFEVNILNKNKANSSYDNAGNSYDPVDHPYDYRSFIVSKWGDNTNPTEVKVSKYVYQAFRVGDKVCLKTFSGAVKITWYKVGLCTTYHD